MTRVVGITVGPSTLGHERRPLLVQVAEVVASAS